jgi:hypothetical protein
MFVKVAALLRVCFYQSAMVFTVSNEFCIVQNVSLFSGLLVNMCAYVDKHMFSGWYLCVNLKKKNMKDSLSFPQMPL